MDIETLRSICLSFPAATEEIKWQQDLAFMVGAKMFCIAGLDACIEDARLAALDNDPGPAEPDKYEPLLSRLEAARTKLPPLYRDTMIAPFLRWAEHC